MRILLYLIVIETEYIYIYILLKSLINNSSIPYYTQEDYIRCAIISVTLVVRIKWVSFVKMLQNSAVSVIGVTTRSIPLFKVTRSPLD